MEPIKKVLLVTFGQIFERKSFSIIFSTTVQTSLPAAAPRHKEVLENLKVMPY